MMNMNLKKYEKLRKKIGYKPVEWLDFSVREHNFCRNHRIEYVLQLIDANLVHNIRGFGVMKVFRLLTATLKRKTGIDFKFTSTTESGTFRIIPKFIFETKQKAESGDALAMLEYSEYLQKYQGLQEAHEWHTKAAKAGNVRAMAEEGNFILYGWIEGSLEEALEYYKKAAEAGIKKSYAALADCYLYGWGCNQDFNKAKKCFKKASRIKHKEIIKKIDSEEFRKGIDGCKKLELIREFYK